jgi:hypothetical protein
MTQGFTPVVSSNLAGYLHRPDGTLLVAFTNGTVYAYEAVPAHVVAALAAASSKGAFFNAQIKKRHPWRRLSDEEVERTVGVAVRAPSAALRATRTPSAHLTELLERYPFLRQAF